MTDCLKTLNVKLPTTLLFSSMTEVVDFVETLNIILLKPKYPLKYEELGELSGKKAVLLFFKKDEEYKAIKEDSLMWLGTNMSSKPYFNLTASVTL